MQQTFRLFYFICLLIFVFAFQYSTAHTVDGLIINDTNLTLALISASTDHGKVEQLPASSIGPYGETTFQLSSPVWNDRIRFVWSYFPSDSWCPISTQDVSGEYEYLFGDNSCTGSSQVCSTYGNMTVVSQNCNGIIGTTNPTFNIYIYLN